MSNSEKTPAEAKRRPENKALRQLRDALQLEGEAWDVFRKHALAGFRRYERSNGQDDEGPLRWSQVPEEWLSDPYVFAYVVVRVLTRGRPDLHGPVALHFFRLIDEQGIEGYSLPIGIGVAWLRLAQLGLTENLNLGAIAELAYAEPEAFFAEVRADDLPELARQCLVSSGPPRAWDMHCLFGAIRAADLPGRQVFHLFNFLMAAEWLTTDVKRELCRGLLGCPAEIQRLRNEAQAVVAQFHSHIESFDSDPFLPRVRLDVAQFPIGPRIPGLRRYAVRALATTCEEPVEQVLDEFFGWCGDGIRDENSSDMVAEGLLDLVDLYAERLGPERVRRWLRRALKQGHASIRQAAYRIGLARFGEHFIRPALKDNAGMVRHWAEKALAAPNKKQFRARAAQKRRF